MIAPRAAPPPTLAASVVLAGFGVTLEGIGLDGDGLAVGGVDAGQVNGHGGDAADFTSGVDRGDPALHARAPLGDDEAVHYQLTVERAGERVAGGIPLRRQPVHQANRQ